MADVKLIISGREYVVTCRDGEESHLETLGGIVDEKARQAGGTAGGMNESRLMLFAALLLADEAHELRGTSKSGPSHATPAASIDNDTSAHIAETLEKLASRIEALSNGA